MPFESFCSQSGIFSDFFFFNEDETLVSSPATTLRRVSHKLSDRTICQRRQRPRGAGRSPEGWHSQYGDDTLRYHSQAQASTELGHQAKSVLQSRLPREVRVRRGMQRPGGRTWEFKPPTETGPYSQPSLEKKLRLSIPGGTGLEGSRMTFSIESEPTSAPQSSLSCQSKPSPSLVFSPGECYQSPPCKWGALASFFRLDPYSV